MDTWTVCSTIINYDNYVVFVILIGYITCPAATTASSDAGGQDIPKAEEPASTSVATETGTIDDPKSYISDSSYYPPLKRFNKASENLGQLFKDSARRRFNQLITEPSKAFQIDQTDRDYTKNVVDNIFELLGALKGIGEVYTNNNFPNLKEVLPEVQAASSTAEAKQVVVTAAAKDVRKMAEHLPSPAAIVSRFTGKPPEKGTSENEKQTESTRHHDAESPDEKASRTYSESDSRTGQHSDSDKSEEVPKQEPSTNLVERVIGGFLTIFPIHNVLWLWPRS